MAALPIIAAVGSLVAGGVSAYGTIMAGRAQAKAEEEYGREQERILLEQAENRKTEAEFVAKQLEAKGKQELAASQVEAMQARRRKKLALSSLQARSAGSGLGADDQTVVSLAEDIERYGTLQELLSTYQGKERRADLEFEAAANRYSADAGARQSALQGASIRRASSAKASSIRSTSALKGASTIIGGVSSFAEKYGTIKSKNTNNYKGYYG